VSLIKIFSVTFSRLLERIDLDLAEQARAEPCAICGDGALHSARYPRKLRGVPDSVAARFTRRESFCCAVDGCRRRTTPPSVVFQGRRLYFAASMMLARAFARGARIHRAERLQALFGVDARTLRRWQQWWCEALPASPFFRAASGRFTPPLEASALPRSLLERFADQSAEKLLLTLLFLAPMTTGSVTFDRTERWSKKTRRAGLVTGR
jgi:hypothetical protein